MAKQEFLLPQMGESITEATIISWSKSVGDHIEEDETLLEIATDKVDTELPSPFEGKVVALLYGEGDIVPVGAPIAVIETMEEGETPRSTDTVVPKKEAESRIPDNKAGTVSGDRATRPSASKRFYSPLVRTIAEIEQLDISVLDQIPGTGAGGRVTKKDVVDYVSHRAQKINKNKINYVSAATPEVRGTSASFSGDVEIIEMDRMRKMIADHMVRSKHTAPHVTSFLEIDVTNIVLWREKVKDHFLSKYGEKITYTPIFIEAVARSIKDFAGINASVDGYKIILKKNINIGMATATSSGNLIVPVIRNADTRSLLEITNAVNDLSTRARIGKLKPEEIQNGTFTLTNVGTFGNTMGTPIINQPQVAILSTGAIKKKPAVIETDNGDLIEVRRFMFLSLSYDHRIVDGALGGQFLRRVGDYLEGFDPETII